MESFLKSLIESTKNKFNTNIKKFKYTLQLEIENFENEE